MREIRKEPLQSPFALPLRGHLEERIWQIAGERRPPAWLLLLLMLAVCLTGPGLQVSSASPGALVAPVLFEPGEALEECPSLETEDWIFRVERVPESDRGAFPQGFSAHLKVRSRTDGEERDLLGSLAVQGPCSLTPFEGILGCNGVAFGYAAGAASAPLVFLRADLSGVEVLARCEGTVYTADLEEDGNRILVDVSTGAFPLVSVHALDSEGKPKAVSLEKEAGATLASLTDTTGYREELPLSLELRAGDVWMEARWPRDGENWTDCGIRKMEFETVCRSALRQAL